MAPTGAPVGESTGSRFRRRATAVRTWLLDRRRLAVAASLVVWAVVISWGSGPAPTERSWLGVPSLGDLLVGLVVVCSVLGLVLLLAMLGSGSRSDVDLPPRKPMWPSLILLLVLVTVLLWLPRNERTEPAPTAPEPTIEIESPAIIPRGVVGRNELVVLAVLIVAAGAVLIWSRRRIAMLGDDDVEQLDLDDRLAPILAEAVESLQLATEPRLAVLRSYATLESAFAGLGWKRRVTETPSEHVRRVLHRFPDAAGPVGELAGLYEIARYSNRPITVDDQRRAASSLEIARTRLARQPATDAAEEPWAPTT